MRPGSLPKDQIVSCILAWVCTDNGGGCSCMSQVEWLSSQLAQTAGICRWV
jgi:hypothetical protein